MAEVFNIWEVIYTSFEAADKNSIGKGFEGDVYNKRALDAAKECLTTLKAGVPIPPFHKQRSNLLPPVAAMMLQGRSSIKVLDFGGGLGIGYMTLAESIPSFAKSVKYSIVEFAEICEQGSKLHSGEINFLSALPDSGQFDLIHSASAIQYIKDWQGLIKKLSFYNPEYILLSDVFAGQIPTFATLQNYYSSKISHWFFNIDEFISFFSSIGYTLEMKSYVNSRRLQSDDILPMGNFPESHRLKQTLHLLFSRDKD